MKQGKKDGTIRRVCLALGWLGLSAGVALAGSTDSPGAVETSSGAMFTLNDIYNVLDTRTTNAVRRTTVFGEPTDGPGTGTMRTLNDIMGLVVNRAPVPKTGWTTSFYLYDDGWYASKVGVAIPAARFVPVATSGAATNQIRDTLTGLIWARDANLAVNSVWSTDGKVTQANALGVVNNSVSGLVNRVSYGGANDWRLPNAKELFSLVDFSRQPAIDNTAGRFVNVQGSSYWSSTHRKTGTGYGWYVGLSMGDCYYKPSTDLYYVWPVRGGGQ